MKTAFIILEEGVIHKPSYLGKSGDFCVLDYLLRNNYDTFVCNANDFQIQGLSTFKALHIKKQDYSQNYYHAVLNECHNIRNGKTPGSGISQMMSVLLEYDEISYVDLQKIAQEGIKPLLISRVMPQSLTGIFLENFSNLAKTMKTIQNMPEIYLYKDKVIPFLLQKDGGNITDFYSTYNQYVSKFKKEITQNSYVNLAIDSILIDINADFKTNYMKISDFAKWPICIKPFNLFGGIGVGLFTNINKEQIKAHLELIRGKFQEFAVIEKQLILIQRAVAKPEFGDIRVIFSHGNFLGAFKRYEAKNRIHNTINGAVIIPICNSKMEFFQTLETKYHSAFASAIKQITTLNSHSDFLKNEFVCGYDLLLDEQNELPQFKMTETNIACPTGFAFLDTSLVYHSIKDINLENIIKYFAENKRIIDSCLSGLSLQ